MTQEEQLKLENQLCFPLYAVSRKITKLYQPFLEPLGLTYPQYLVMMVLWEKDQLPVTTIGKLLDLESNTLTPLLKRMESNQLLERHRSVEDERKVIVFLTQKGKGLREKAFSIPKSVFEQIDLSMEEAKQLQVILCKLR